MTSVFKQLDIIQDEHDGQVYIVITHDTVLTLEEGSSGYKLLRKLHSPKKIGSLLGTAEIWRQEKASPTTPRFVMGNERLWVAAEEHYQQYTNTAIRP